MSDGYVSKVDRRTALAWIGAAGAAVAGGVGLAVYGAGDRTEARGYGTDPNLVKPDAAPWLRLLTRDELQATSILADFILPASATAPAASALGIPDFIDEWVSAPYPDQVKDRVVIRNGLQRAMPALLAGGARRAEALAALPRAADEASRTFFRRFRALTVGAYYTTEAGFRDIGYIGNQARASDPGPSAEVRAVLEERLRALGL